MQQPSHDLRAFQSSAASPRRFLSVGLVALLHVVIIYALASGLAANLASKLPTELKAEVVQEKPPQQEKTPPPPPPDLAKPPPPFVPPPDINIQSEAPATNAISNVQSKQAAPAQSAAITYPKPIGHSHGACQDHYPPISVRLNETGVVTVKYVVNTDGSVGDVSVVKSSGYSRLDEAATQCVKEYWRQTPAMQDGHPMAVTVQARILYQLK
jgi:protein TonB